MTIRVGILGGSGFAGSTLIQLLQYHSDVEITYVSSRKYVGKYITSVIPNLHGKSKLKFEYPDISLLKDRCDLVFVAVPHHTSHEIVPKILDQEIKVIDLSADFRLKDITQYENYYGVHSNPELLKESVYGMPELYREQIKEAKLVAVPGCQAASAIYALAPLIKENLIDLDHIIIDSKTGSSGSGATPTEASHHPIRANSIRAYKLGGHRHTAEIEQELGRLANKEIIVGFSAHAVNLTRGILSTCYTYPSKPEYLDEKIIIRAYRKFYKNEPFIRFRKLKTGVFRLPDPKLIMGTNFVDIGFEIDPHSKRIISLSSLDNLVKGTAGNAIQSMNIMFGIQETKSLEFLGVYPY